MVRILALLGVFEARIAGRERDGILNIARGGLNESKPDELEWLNNNKITYYTYLMKCNSSTK